MICYFKRGLHLFKGLCLLFLPNVPGATLIKGGTFIPESRVGDWPNSLDCTDLKISVEPAVTQNCVPLLQTNLFKD